METRKVPYIARISMEVAGPWQVQAYAVPLERDFKTELFESIVGCLQCGIVERGFRCIHREPYLSFSVAAQRRGEVIFLLVNLEGLRP